MKFEVYDKVIGKDKATLKEWSGTIYLKTNGKYAVLNENTRHWKYLDELIGVRRLTEADQNKNEEYKSYSEFIDSRVQSLIDKKVDFGKADPNTKKTMAHKYADIAKGKFEDLDGQPKNDNEAETVFNNSVDTKMAEKDAQMDASKQEEVQNAEKEIEELSQKLTEEIYDNLNIHALKLLREAQEL